VEGKGAGTGTRRQM